jgi:D-lyxose ketol-isomerase
MKRSEVNQIIRQAEQFFAQHHFNLPAFAKWTPHHWQGQGQTALEVVQNALGWDVTDYGTNDFAHIGVVLFTLRNGTLEQLAQGAGKVYCEKVLICQPDQLVVHHFHKSKTEDIINRAGGRLEVVLHQANLAGEITPEDITVSVDGVSKTVKMGGIIVLEPGESITLEPYQYHQFRALESAVLVGEVSTVNDDANDNFFLEPVGRFPEIEEDELPYRLLCNEYSKFID